MPSVNFDPTVSPFLSVTGSTDSPPGMINAPPALQATGINGDGVIGGFLGVGNASPSDAATAGATANGDPNNPIAQIAMLAGLIANPLSMAITVPVSLASMVDSDVAAPPSVTGILGHMFGLTGDSSPANVGNNPTSSGLESAASSEGLTGMTPAQAVAQAQQDAASAVALSGAGKNAGVGASGTVSSSGNVGAIGSPTGGAGRGGMAGAPSPGGVGNAGVSTGMGNTAGPGTGASPGR